MWLAWLGLIAAVGVTPDTRGVFEEYAPAVLRIQVLESGSLAKSSIGSGFFVTDSGLVITNYHVVARLIRHPDRYRAEYLDEAGNSGDLRIRAIDVVHDLAVVEADTARPGAVLSFAPESPRQGARVYALGHPHDLGLSIVEGTYNGLREHALYPKIHFTGSLNPGMSGGPAIVAEGRVVGVNVSTAGNQVSFLVPAEQVELLLSRAREEAVPENLLTEVRDQLLVHQQTYLDRVLSDGITTTALGGFELPDRIAPFFNCWADANTEKDRRYDSQSHQCSTEDAVYLAENHWSGVVSYRHQVLRSRDLNRFQFYTLFSERFSDTFNFGRWSFLMDDEEVTRFSCLTDTVDNDNLVMRAVLCARGYRELPGLHDVFIKTAVLGHPLRGLESTATLSGVSFENGLRFAARYLESIRRSEENGDDPRAE